MPRKFALTAVCALLPAAALAHLCNDVFAQAKDNLIVKVDIRDGQLRIGQQASFRVYLMNTMDREIAKIGLEVRCAQFRAEVQPSPDWRNYPVLRPVPKKVRQGGGKKEYFTVTLTRNPGVPDGKYQIELVLFDPSKKSRVFKTADLDSAAALAELPKAAGIKVDGAAGQAEWGQSFVCTDFHAHVKKGHYFVNQPAQDQPRFRLAADAENLYCLLQFQGGAEAKADQAALYVAPDPDSKPVIVTFDRVSGQAGCEKGLEGAEFKAGADKSVVECRIPRGLLGIKDAKSFQLNFARTVTGADDKQETVYWRGNASTLGEPAFYGQFTVAGQ